MDASVQDVRSLPDDVLGSIIQLLPRSSALSLRLACKRFKDAVDQTLTTLTVAVAWSACARAPQTSVNLSRAKRLRTLVIKTLGTGAARHGFRGGRRGGSMAHARVQHAGSLVDMIRGLAHLEHLICVRLGGVAVTPSELSALSLLRSLTCLEVAGLQAGQEELGGAGGTAGEEQEEESPGHKEQGAGDEGDAGTGGSVREEEGRKEEGEEEEGRKKEGRKEEGEEEEGTKEEGRKEEGGEELGRRVGVGQTWPGPSTCSLGERMGGGGGAYTTQSHRSSQGSLSPSLPLSLTSLTSLTSLSLGDDAHLPSLVARRALAAVALCTGLRSLSLCQWDPQPRVLFSLSALTALSHFALTSASGRITTASLQALCSLTSLQNIQLEGDSEPGGADLGVLGVLPRLTSITARLTDPGGRHVEALTPLTRLTQLLALDLAAAALPPGLPSALSHLTRLRASSARVPHAAWAALVRAAPGLEEVEVGWLDVARLAVADPHPLQPSLGTGAGGVVGGAGGAAAACAASAPELRAGTMAAAQAQVQHTHTTAASTTNPLPSSSQFPLSTSAAQAHTPPSAHPPAPNNNSTAAAGTQQPLPLPAALRLRVLSITGQAAATQPGWVGVSAGELAPNLRALRVGVWEPGALAALLAEPQPLKLRELAIRAGGMTGMSLDSADGGGGAGYDLSPLAGLLQLEALALSNGCGALTADTPPLLHNILPALPHLTQLSLEGGRGRGDVLVGGLPHAVPGLEELGLCGLEGVTDRAITELAAARQLRTLRLTRLGRGVTLAGLSVLVLGGKPPPPIQAHAHTRIHAQIHTQAQTQPQTQRQQQHEYRPTHTSHGQQAGRSIHQQQQTSGVSKGMHNAMQGHEEKAVDSGMGSSGSGSLGCVSLGDHGAPGFKIHGVVGNGSTIHECDGTDVTVHECDSVRESQVISCAPCLSLLVLEECAGVGGERWAVGLMAAAAVVGRDITVEVVRGPGQGRA